MARAERVTSAANPLLKDVRRAIARGGLTSEGFAVAETFHLLEEALRSGCQIAAVVAAESVRATAESHVRRLAATRVAVVPDALLDGISGMETSQGVIALVKPPEWKLEQVFGNHTLVVLLDGIQDPGNAGTIVRTAEAFGATGVLFLKGTVSPYNPKTLRASAGSLFRVPSLHGLEPALVRAALRENHARLYAAVPARDGAAAGALAKVDFTARCGVVIGSEAHGVGAELRAAAVEVAIPTVRVESLNAAMAAGILLYEARRQRAVRP